MNNGKEKAIPIDVELVKLLKRQSTLNPRIISGELCVGEANDAIQRLLDNQRSTRWSLLPHPQVQVAMAMMLRDVLGLQMTDTDFRRLHEQAGQSEFRDYFESRRPYQAVILKVKFGSPHHCLEKLWKLVEQSHPSANLDLRCKGNTPKLGDFRHNSSSSVAYYDATWELIDFGEWDSERECLFGLDYTALWAMIYNPRFLKDLPLIGVKDLWITGFHGYLNGHSLCLRQEDATDMVTLNYRDRAEQYPTSRIARLMMPRF